MPCILTLGPNGWQGPVGEAVTLDATIDDPRSAIKMLDLCYDHGTHVKQAPFTFTIAAGLKDVDLVVNAANTGIPSHIAEIGTNGDTQAIVDFISESGSPLRTIPIEGI